MHLMTDNRQICTIEYLQKKNKTLALIFHYYNIFAAIDLKKKFLDIFLGFFQWYYIYKISQTLKD